MRDNEFLEQLRDALLEEAASNPTAEELEEFWSTPADISPDRLEKIRKQFVKKVLEKLHPEPVRNIENGVTLVEWLGAVRNTAHLTHSFIATALGETASFVEQIEKGDILPWDIPPITGANIAALFRVHFTAFSKLTANSYSALEYALNDPLKTEGAGRTSDALPSKNPLPDKTSNQAEVWLGAVQSQLEKNQAAYLLF